MVFLARGRKTGLRTQVCNTTRTNYKFTHVRSCMEPELFFLLVSSHLSCSSFLPRVWVECN